MTANLDYEFFSSPTEDELTTELLLEDKIIGDVVIRPAGLVLRLISIHRPTPRCASV